MKKTFKLLFSSLTILVIILSPTIVFAGSIPPDTTIGVSIPNPFKCSGTGECSLMGLITAILTNIIMPIATVAVTMWIIWAGFQFLTAQGKPAEIDKAKQNLLWSLIGAGVLLGAVGISRVVQNTINALIN